MVRIKICGLTNIDDALLAAELGAHAVGFIFYPDSPRHVTPETVARITAVLPPLITRVGVFVNEPSETVREIAARCGLDVAQLHGDERPDACRVDGLRVIKGFRPRRAEDLAALAAYPMADAFLLDTYHPAKAGGTGKTFDWELAVAAKRYGRPVVLSGGLGPDNVADAIERVQPYAVDVSSGVEAEPGRKDPDKLAAFIEAALAAKSTGQPKERVL